MKNIATIILAAALAIAAQPAAKFEFGRATNHDLYFTEMSMDYSYKLPVKKINIAGRTYGSILSWQSASDHFTFYPFEVIYKIGNTFTCNIFFVKFEHYCCHPVVSAGDIRALPQGQGIYGKINTPDFWWDGTMQTVSIGVEYTFK